MVVGEGKETACVCCECLLKVNWRVDVCEYGLCIVQDDGAGGEKDGIDSVCGLI